MISKLKDMDVKDLVINCSVPEALHEHCKEFERGVIKVTDGVYVAIGYGIANSILLDAPAGLIIVDTQESTKNGKAVMEDFRKLFPDKPVKGIIYTHSHEDHMTGTKAFLPKIYGNIEVWAHEKFMEMVTSSDQTVLRGALLPRIIRQFAMGSNHVVNCGVGPFYTPDPLKDIVWPTNLVKGVHGKVDIAGLEVELLHIPGETMCHLGVWIPSKRVFLPGDDIYKCFPNLYAIRGSVPRSVTDWINSLDKMRKLKPQFLVPSHTRPISGEDEVMHQLTIYRDGIQYVHDQTMRLMNKGMHPVEIARNIKLPKSIRDEPYLQHFYGNPEWSSRAVFDAYVGWFSGSAEELYPLTPSDRGKNMIKSFGLEKVCSEAQNALDDNNIQWALELSTHILRLYPDNTVALGIRTKALIEAASRDVSANGRNYLLTTALEDNGLHPSRYPTAFIIHSMPLSTLLAKMKASVKAENIDGKDLTLTLQFRDLNSSTTLHIRNSILEVTTDTNSNANVVLDLDLSSLRQLLAGDKDLSDLIDDKIVKVIGDGDQAKEFFDCLETADVEWRKGKLSKL